MPICPAGHQTQQSDFCDICGLPVPGGQTGIPSAPPPLVAASPVICPNCQTPNVADALFCEACGYDFTTGTMPAPVASAVLPGPTPAVAAQPTPSDPVLVDAILGPSGDAAQAAADASEPATDPVSGDDAHAALAADPTDPSAAGTPGAAGAEPGAVAQARPAVEWVAELWIDPDWYTAQGSTDPLPSPGLPDIVPLVKESNLVGRVSHSRGIFPDVDCELDTGCSRRHAMLTTDGTRWWIEDLNSANGTFVGAAAGPLPAMPIPQGRVELSPGQRIYVGAWTRIVIRRATDDEKEAFAG